MSERRTCPTCGQPIAGNGLIALRESLGLSLRAVQEKSGLHISIVSRVEHGKDANVSTVVALANVYGITVDELLRLRSEGVSHEP